MRQMTRVEVCPDDRPSDAFQRFGVHQSDDFAPARFGYRSNFLRRRLIEIENHPIPR